jgi:hypothetical protein
LVIGKLFGHREHHPDYFDFTVSARLQHKRGRDAVVN